MTVTVEKLSALVKKIADQGSVELCLGPMVPGLGMDYSYVKLTADEIELWKEVTQ